MHFCLLGCGGNLGTVASVLLSPCAPATQAEACCEAALRPPEAAAVPSAGRRLDPHRRMGGWGVVLDAPALLSAGTEPAGCKASPAVSRG